MIAVVGEVRARLDEERGRGSSPAVRAASTASNPPPSRAGAGLLAQRLVATILVLLPATVRSRSTVERRSESGRRAPARSRPPWSTP